MPTTPATEPCWPWSLRTMVQDPEWQWFRPRRWWFNWQDRDLLHHWQPPPASRSRDVVRRWNLPCSPSHLLPVIHHPCDDTQPGTLLLLSSPNHVGVDLVRVDLEGSYPTNSVKLLWICYSNIRTRNTVNSVCSHGLESSHVLVLGYSHLVQMMKQLVLLTSNCERESWKVGMCQVKRLSTAYENR